MIRCRYGIFFVYALLNSGFTQHLNVVHLDTQQRPGMQGAANVGDIRPLAGFVVSLISGVLILAGGVAMLGYSSGIYGDMMGGYSGMMGGYGGGMMGGYGGGMMGGYYGMMQGFGGWFYGFAILGIAAGVVVLFGAIMMYDRPRQVPIWGALVVAFSVVSFFGAGGFFVGAVLGVMGGILALTWREVRPTV